MFVCPVYYMYRFSVGLRHNPQVDYENLFKKRSLEKYLLIRE